MTASARAKRPVRVAVNLLWLVPGVVGGTEGYATALLREVARRGEIDCVLAVLPEFAAAHPDLAASLRTVVAPLPPGRRVIRRVALEPTWLAWQLRRWRPDVVHHLGGTALAATAARTVLTIHDLQYQHFPQYFPAAKKAYLRAATRTSVRRADHLVTISDFSRHDLGRRLGVEPARITVVPPWLPPAAALDAPPPLELPELPALPERYLLYPAATYPHKNHAVLLEALARLGRRAGDLHLVLTGAGGAGTWGSAASSHADLRGAVQRLGLTGRVHELAWLPRRGYLQVLQRATALAFPSRFEGYGLPVAEAMAAGVPVLCSDAASLPEVVGRGVDAGGVLLPPDDATAWAAAIEALGDPAHRHQLRQRAVQRDAVLRRRDPVEVLTRLWCDAATLSAA